MSSPRISILTFIALFYCAAMPGTAQQKSSKAFRIKSTPVRMYEIRQSDVTYQLWEGFQLMRNANAGDAPSQHELSLRYLTGTGFTADTVRAAQWMKKAADQGYILAKFNYGIYLNNGWGVDWDPFEAYRYFVHTAEKNMREGQYVLGVLYTDNLTIPRNYQTAYDWVYRSAQQGYQPAKELLGELEKRGITGTESGTKDSTKTTKRSVVPIQQALTTNQAIQPVLLDFDEDTTVQADDMTLLQELFNEGNEELRTTLGISRILADSLQSDSTGFALISRAAEVGNPEAMTIVARCYERGVGVKKDKLTAAVHYIRAVRLDSRRAPALLWRLINEKNTVQIFQQQAAKKNPQAQYVVSSLAAFRFTNSITEEQALQFLMRSSEQSFIPAILDMGNAYSQGQWVKQDRKKAVEFWKKAAAMGNAEGNVRVAVSQVFDGTITDAERSFAQLLEYSQQGSVLAQTALGYCYERGVTVPIDESKAIFYYRNSSQRGSQSAMTALARMYDDRRPSDPRFKVEPE
ncbi:MAG: sel1 repeat family protein [Bacteroidetes bacterium]|nr:sel1 repeat family protein [Bacteroidota bacterium]